MKTLKKCEICGKDKFDFMFRQKDKNFNVQGEFSLYKCKNCGIIFINPQPAGNELERHYPKGYYSFNKIITKEKSRREGFKLFLYNLYFNPRNKNLFLKLMFSPFLFYMRGTYIKKNGRILDMGCGSGQFLYEMKQFEMETYGIEPGESDIQNIKNFNIKHSLGEAKYPSGFFDVITMNQVLHHMDNPSETLSELNRVLKKGGKFILCVSNYRSLAQVIFKKEWYQYDVPRHLFNFSDKILVDFLRNKGFKIIKIKYNSRPNQFVNSFYYKKNIKKRGGVFYNSLKIMLLPLTLIVNLLKIGDQVEIWCTK